eukprot:6182114-Pleurochrysis_carterae.AAC.4
MKTWSKSRTRVAREQQALSSLEDGVFKHGTKYGWRTIVPRQKCFDLVRATDRFLDTVSHLDAAALASRLRRNFYWEFVLTLCGQM